MKTFFAPLLLVALLSGLPALAQQGGVTILRGQGADQPAPTTPDTGVRRVPTDRNAAPRPAQAPVPTAPIAVSPNGMVPVAPPSEVAQAIVSSKPLDAAEAAALASALKAVDESRWADARAMVANFRNPALTRIVEWSILRTAPRTEADFATTWRFLRENPDWPEPEVLRRQAEERLGPETPASDVFRYVTAFPPLTSSGHMRRLEAANTVSPNDVAKFARDSWQNATFRNSDENDFLNRYGYLLTGPDQIARFDRILREGRPQIARELLPKLPPD